MSYIPPILFDLFLLLLFLETNSTKTTKDSVPLWQFSVGKSCCNLFLGQLLSHEQVERIGNRPRLVQWEKCISCFPWSGDLENVPCCL